MTNKILESASKLVLLYLVGILGILSLVAGVWSMIQGNYSDAAKEVLSLFTNAMMFLFGFYFNNKGDTNVPNQGK